MEAIYLNPLVTLKLVGRKDELKRIKEVICGPSNRCFILITGSGGIGKSRLVEEVLTNPPSCDMPLLVASLPVDMYHISNHTIEGFLSALHKTLDPDSKRFGKYLEERENLRKVEAPGWQAQLEKVVQAFLQDFKEIANNYRILFALDTLERLFPLKDPVVDRLGLPLEKSLDLWSWLERSFFPALENVVILLAGRSFPRGLQDRLKKIGSLMSLPLSGLNEEESIQYFEEAIQALRTSSREWDHETAERLERRFMDRDRRLACFYALRDDDGKVRPILFALVIDYLAIQGTIEIPTSSIEARGLPREERERIKRDLLSGIVRLFQESIYPLEEEANIILEKLPRLPKGAEPKLLADLVGLDQEQVEQVCERLQRLSFIKRRPEDKRLFLHDEMYTLLRKCESHLPEEDYYIIRRYYDDRIKRERAHLENLHKQYHKSKKLNWENLTRSLSNLWDALTENLYYELDWDAEQGFLLYSRLADEAIAIGDATLDEQLRAEILDFWQEHDPEGKAKEIKGLRRADLLADAAVRWVKRLVSQGKYGEALQIADHLHHDARDLVEGGGRLAEAELLVWEALALVYQARHNEAEPLFKKAQRLLEEASSERCVPRQSIIYGRLYNNWGYLRRVQGQFLAAADMYKKALKYWRETKLEAEQANTLTNRAFTLALQGKFDVARRLLEDALSLRRKQGIPRAVALTLNARAYVELYDGSFEEAERYAKEALMFAEQTDFPRAQAMAHLTLAACYRFKSEPGVGEEAPLAEDKRKLLEESLKHGKQALEILKQSQIEETERIITAYYEQGLTFRELLRLSPKYVKEEERREFERRAEQFLGEAARMAKENNLWSLYLDASLGIAWFYYYIQREEDLNKHLDMLEREIDQSLERYKIVGERRPSIEDDTELGIFSQLARLHVLKGVRAMDAFEHSDKVEPYPHLRQAAREFALALEYDVLIADEFRDLRRAINLIYSRLKKLNQQEIKAFVEEVKKHWKECRLLHEIEEHFGIPE